MKNVRIFFLVSSIMLVMAIHIVNGQSYFEPVNKNATPEVRKMLQYLYSVRGQKIISGQHNYPGMPDLFPDSVKKMTGMLPQIWGCDFINYYRAGEPEMIVRNAYKKFQEGYFITLMWHVGRPQDDPPYGWKESIQNKMTDSQWVELTTPGTELNSRWIKKVDTIAVYLKALQIMGVPVLWRPYHELNGVWFWWGNRKGENGSAKLYRMMYDRYVNFHKLNNLIWVWNTNAPRDLLNDEAYAYKDFYPGSEYVDVLAADIYHNDYKQSHHDELLELGRGKLIALGEIGEVPIPEILKQQPMWSWFMIWADWLYTHNSAQQIRDLYNYPKVLKHEDFTNDSQTITK